MFKRQRNGHQFEFSIGPTGGAVIKTSAPGESWKVVDLENRFPGRLIDFLHKLAYTDTMMYASIGLRLPRQEKDTALMVRPHTDQQGERWINFHWFEPINHTTTRFTMAFRVGEIRQLLEYVDEDMTC